MQTHKAPTSAAIIRRFGASVLRFINGSFAILTATRWTFTESANETLKITDFGSCSPTAQKKTPVRAVSVRPRQR